MGPGGGGGGPTWMPRGQGALLPLQPLGLGRDLRGRIEAMQQLRQGLGSRHRLARATDQPTLRGCRQGSGDALSCSQAACSAIQHQQ